MKKLKNSIGMIVSRYNHPEEESMNFKAEHLKLSREGGGGRMKRNEKLTGLLRHH